MHNKNDYPKPGEDNVSNVVSTTECTGLVQGLPEEDEEMEALTEIYRVPEQEGLNAFMDEQDELSRMN